MLGFGEILVPPNCKAVVSGRVEERTRFYLGRHEPIYFVNLTSQFVDARTLRATVPPGAGMVEILVQNPDGQTATLPRAYTYISSAPDVIRVVPMSGPVSGGNEITISGSNFQRTPAVRFGSTPAPSVTWVDLTTIRAVAPAGTGVVSVTVVNPDGQSFTLANAYTYVVQTPTISRIDPATGPEGTVTVVTISGNNFQRGARVRFGLSDATNVNWVSAERLTAAAPAGTGTVNVTVINPDGQSATLPNGYSYIRPTASNPSITASVQGCRVSGSISGVNAPAGFRILVWARTNQFYIQPCDLERTQLVRADGTFGPIDLHNGDVFLQLVNSSYTPPATTGTLPQVDNANVFVTVGPVGVASGCNVARCPAR